MTLTPKLLVLGGICICLTCGLAGLASRAASEDGTTVCSVPQVDAEANALPQVTGRRPDLSGHTRIGKASYYAHSFANRLMANGHKMNPRGNNAASRTLPLGTTARVVNVRTGQSAVVAIEDRGPYVRGRIVDLSPTTARQIGITRHLGVAEVKVAPISVQLPDGTSKPGSGWRKASCRVYKS